MNLHSTVLIVDDNDLNRETLEMLLTNQGYNLESACNGFEGLEKTRELEPDLILLDVMMPDIDGFEVCRRIRADSILGEIPIILVTALDDRESRLEGIEAGADDFITKPYDRVELRTRVRTITRLNRFRRLMSERTKFEWVIDQADEGYLAIADAGQINYANKQARLYLNLPPDGDLPITETFQALVGRQYRLEPDSAWESWPQTPTIDADQKRYLVRPETLTATAFWLEVDILHLDASTKNQNDATWIIKLKDVTKSMAITQNMWEFGAMVSHKLRTPLIGMLSGMELLTQFGTDLSQAEMVQLAEQALHGVRRLRSEIDGILHYMGATRVSGKGSDERIFVKQLPAMIETICTETDISKAYIHHIEGEQSQLKISVHSMELILREILENSKNFHPHQKPAIAITIEQTTANKIKITITDDGIHLSPEQLAKALTPYYQGEKYFTGEAKGMGLGLSMVASSVWSIGGTCKIFNRDDAPGVVVELTLPIFRKLHRLANRIAEKKK
jgi:two-component system cell cycle response regulator